MPAGSTPSAGHNVARSASPLAAGATIPLAFIASGIVAAVAGTSWLAADPDLLTLPHLHPEVVAFAHLWLLGALLTICFGAVYQLLPVLANTAFTGAKLAWSHLAVHAAGVLLMVDSFQRGDLGRVALGGALVTTGAILFGLNVLRVLRTAPRRDSVLAAFGCAAGWLLLTALAGLLLALDLRFGWWPMDVLAVLRAHAHLGVVGFFLTLLQGALFRLVPMFTLTDPPDLRRVGRILFLSQAGLLVLVPGLAWSIQTAEAAGALLLLVSFSITAFELRRLLATRRKRTLEPALKGFLLGLALLGLAALAGAALVFAGGEGNRVMAYGFLAICGGLLATIEGMLGKIIPFLVWMRVYGPRVGRQPVPQAASLGSVRCERAWLVLHGGATLLLALGVMLAEPAVLVVGAITFASGQAMLLLGFGRAVRHLRPSGRGRAASTLGVAKGIA